MNKSELLNWLREEQQQWEAFLGQIDPARMEQPGVNGPWSMKDMVAHMNGYQPKINDGLRAAQRGELEPPPPWPAHLQTDDEINAWIYEAHRDRSLSEVLAESHRLVQELIAVIEGLPGDVLIEEERHRVHLGDQSFAAGDYFDHYHDDHEADVRAWLAQTGNP
jgi:hypothetical protein